MSVQPTFARAANGIRSSILAEAIVGIVIGLIALFWPGPTLLVIAALFGTAVIITGVLRLALAFSFKNLPTGARVVLGLLGALMVVAGVLCLVHPVFTLVFIAIMIGISWLFGGVHDLVAAVSGTQMGPRWLALLSGAVSIVAGIVVFTLPGLAIATFITWGAILLIVVSVLTLFKLPRKLPVSS